MNDQQWTRSAKAVSTAARDERRRVVRVMIVLFLAAGMVAALTVTASGQAPKYDQIKLQAAYEDPNNVKRMKDAAKRIAVTKDPNTFPQRRYAEVFFKTYVPAKITQLDSISEITPLMNEVMMRLASAQRSKTPATNTLISWIYGGLKPIAQGNYHPAARISAIVAISKIDEARADYRQGRPPKPLRYILTDFLPLYEDENNPDGVRAAALQGLHRYAMYAGPSITGANLTKLKSLMNDLLSQDPPADRSPKAHAYLQRYAVDILSSLRGKSDPALGQQLISISTEVKKPDLIALHSAARLGDMAPDIQGNVNAPDDVLAKWAARAMRAFQYEAIRLKALDRPKAAPKQPSPPRSVVRPATEKPSAAGSASGEEDYDMAEMGYEQEEGEMDDDAMMTEDYGDMEMMMGMGESLTMSQPKAKAQPPEVFASRRKLNFVLQQLHLGATGSTAAGVPSTPGGLLAAVADDNKATVEGWVTSMGDVLTALNDETLDDREKYIEAVMAQAEILRDIAGPAAEEAEEAAPLEIPGVSPVVTAAKEAGEDESVAADQPAVDQAGVPQLPVEDELSLE